MVNKFYKWVENTVGKGEIARYKQFLLFPQHFLNTCTADTSKPGLVWERVKCFTIRIERRCLLGVRVDHVPTAQANTDFNAAMYDILKKCSG